LVNLTQLYRSNEIINNSDEIELDELVRKLDQSLVNTEVNLWEGTRELREFLSQVKQQVKEHLNHED
jgi:hypothetical protein